MASNVDESSSSSGTVSKSTSASDEDSSSEEDDDEFYDALEPTSNTLLRYCNRKVIVGPPPDRVDLCTLTPEQIDGEFSAGNVSNVSNASSTTTFISMGSSNSNSINSVSSPRTTIEREKEEEEERRRKRMDEMRRRLNMEEVEDIPEQQDGTTSPSDSQTSSVEGLYGAALTSKSNSSHPFKVVDHDNVSMASGVSAGGRSRNMYSGTVGTPTSSTAPGTSGSFAVPNSLSIPSSPRVVTKTISGGMSTSTPTSPLQSPSEERPVPAVPCINASDVVSLSSCTKTKSKASSDVPDGKPASDSSKMPMPIAPPRKKRVKSTLSAPISLETNGGRGPVTSSISESSSATSPVLNPPSPTVSIRSVCKEMDKLTLENPNSTSRIWLVKAQDEEKTRARNSGPKVLKRTESLPKDAMVDILPTGASGSGSRSSTLAGAAADSAAGSRAGTGTRSHGEALPMASVVSALAAIEDKNDKDKQDQLTAHVGMLDLDSSELQMNLKLRTRTDSGKLLSDLEILEQVLVVNLDTGEKVPLSAAEEKLPKCMNPLSLHIMRLTSEYSGIDGSVGGNVAGSVGSHDSDDESVSSKKSSIPSQEDDGASSTSGISVRRRRAAQIKRFFGSTVKKTVTAARSFAHSRTHKEDVDITETLANGGRDVVDSAGGPPGPTVGPQVFTGPEIKIKASHSHKGPYDFDSIQQVQDLQGQHVGPVWCMKFSNCGRLLATAGQDKTIRIWVLKDHLPYFQDMRTKHVVDKVSPTPSQESIVSQHSQHSVEEMMAACEASDPRAPFVPRPLCIYTGHTSDLLDIAWSKSFFLLSSSMDRTVRLWHISRRECLCCFQHIDFVTAIAFHPRDDRYFLSGSLDGKLRLWNIPDKKVALWNEVNGTNNLITTANFCQQGKFAVVGTLDGRCIFYHTEQLKYHTQIFLQKRKKSGAPVTSSQFKITGIEPLVGEDKLLVTSNDSRIRLYDLRDLTMTCKYKGFVNKVSQIKATMSHDGKYIVCGSENQMVYIWKTYHHEYMSKLKVNRRDRNGFWEAIKAHNAVVTCVVFAPDPDIIVRQITAKERELREQNDPEASTDDNINSEHSSLMVKSPSLTKNQNSGIKGSSLVPVCPLGYVLVSADFSGCIKVFLSKMKPKHSSLPASALA